jgi:hypothetical protein
MTKNWTVRFELTEPDSSKVHYKGIFGYEFFWQALAQAKHWSELQNRYILGGYVEIYKSISGDRARAGYMNGQQFMPEPILAVFEREGFVDMTAQMDKPKYVKPWAFSLLKGDYNQKVLQICAC